VNGDALRLWSFKKTSSFQFSVKTHTLCAGKFNRVNIPVPTGMNKTYEFYGISSHGHDYTLQNLLKFDALWFGKNLRINSTEEFSYSSVLEMDFPRKCQ
jgi:hypothetical protein